MEMSTTTLSLSSEWGMVVLDLSTNVHVPSKVNLYFIEEITSKTIKVTHGCVTLAIDTSIVKSSC